LLDPKGRERIRIKPATETEQQSSVAQIIERRNLLGGGERRPQWQQVRGRRKLNARGERRSGGKHHQRIRQRERLRQVILWQPE